MSFAQRESISVVTGTGGDGTSYSTVVTGLVDAMHYVKTDYSDGVDFDVTVESTGEILWDQDNVNSATSRRPRFVGHDGTGVALTGTAHAVVPVAVANDRIKVIVTNGGSVKTGAIVVVLT